MNTEERKKNKDLFSELSWQSYNRSNHNYIEFRQDELEKYVSEEAARNKEIAIAFLKFREEHCVWVGGVYEWTTDLPGHKGFYKRGQLYDLFINEQNKKV